MTIANLSSVPVSCPTTLPVPEKTPSEKQKIEDVDLTYSTYDEFEDSTQFFYFSTERPPPPPPPKTPTKKQRSSLTKRQWLVIANFILVNFSGATCVSLQAPFYPAEAEKKGVTASQYGFVFGVFELVVFIISPVYGKYIGKIGHKFLVTCGIFLTSTCCILFGLLDRIENADSFLTLSFLVRIVEAIGQAGYLTGSFTIIAQEFPNKVASMFAMLEAAYGVGLFIGPTVGGLLFEVGGYSLPFMVTGSLLLVATVFTFFILPSQAHVHHQNRLSIFRLLQLPTVAIAGYFTICASISIGFLVAVLEPHLRKFSLTPSEMGAMFIISGGLYALTTPMWGRLCESVISPFTACGIGGGIMTVAYLLLGPSPMMPFKGNLWVVVIGLTFHGFGLAAELVGSFGLAHRGAVKHGFPDNIGTYGLVSGYWTSLFAFGAFVGPSIAGVLLDTVGFEIGSQVVLFLHSIAVVVTIIWLFMNRHEKNSLSSIEKGEPDEKTPLVY